MTCYNRFTVSLRDGFCKGNYDLEVIEICTTCYLIYASRVELLWIRCSYLPLKMVKEWLRDWQLPGKSMDLIG